MDFEFFKYQGAGNDFILIDNRDGIFPTDNRVELIQQMCQRKFGIGSDGLILLENDSDVDFYMEFFNPDGSQSFCGNGSRCAVMFAFHLGMIQSSCSFKSIHGTNQAEIFDSRNVKLKMFDVQNIETTSDYHYMNTGSPHYNVLVEEVDEIDLIGGAHKIRYNERFRSEGTNVNFITKADGGIKVRTYERGVEDETLSCGTGVTACAISSVLWSNEPGKHKVSIQTRGGQLFVECESDDLKSFSNIFLIGPADFVYKGEFDV